MTKDNKITKMTNKQFAFISTLLVIMTSASLYYALSIAQMGSNLEGKNALHLSSSSIQSANHTGKTKEKSNAYTKSILLSSDARKNNNIITIDNLWYPLEEDDAIEGITLDQRITGAEKIGMNSRVLPTLIPGDKIKLPPIHGKTFFLEAKRILQLGAA